MNTEKSTGTKKNGAAGNKFEDEFRALPLEDKFKSLFRMEAAALEETFHYVADASMKAFEKAGEVITDLGKKVESEVKKATASKQTADPPKSSASTGSAKKKSSAGRKQPPKSASK